VPPIDDYDITHGYTYMYFTGEPVFPFGYGLSYTTFRYGDLKLSSATTTPEGKITLWIDVTNTGSRAGDEVVQFYAHQRKCSVKQPIEKLMAFARVHLEAGETKTVAQDLDVQRMAIWNINQHKFVVEPGTFDAMAGSSSRDIRAGRQFDVTP